MKRNRIAIAASALLAGASMLLAGCQADTSGLDDKGFKPHLTVDLQLPEQLEQGQEGRFAIVVKENGEPYDGFYQARFQLWPEDGSSAPVTAQAEKTAPGTYSFVQAIGPEGVYRIKFSGVSADYEIMPSKRFAIGSEAVEALAEMEKAGAAAAVPAPAGHHH
ncbi:FixH family protein [Paenibacillus pasadenensis]|uniref:Uncharacterized protein n=1 Tax=Paenibacillus pasadenensis TaxID=217090 RepID=A0A2N5N9P9_9BACL|nr:MULTISPECIES: FixH family protein [Paenibacillus]PLT47010.1 hypothetical protein B8V81_1234 [Paenibacillus pasadenensis]QGG57345.1 hypothetical protein GE073_18265 [Paenibacillus sp. B01]